MVSGPNGVKYSLPMSEPWRHWTLDLNSEAGSSLLKNLLQWAVSSNTMIKIDWGKIQFLSNARWRATYLLHQAGTSWLIGACVCQQKGADFYCWFNLISHTPNFVQKHSILSSKGSLAKVLTERLFLSYTLFFFLTEPLFFALPNKIPPLLLFHNSAQFRTISQPNSFLKFCNGKN